MIRNSMRLLAALLLGVPLVAQTEVDLRTQAKSADFQNFGSTRPLKTGTLLPSTCNVGEMYFLTTAAPGTNVYACTAANIWTVQTGGGAGASTIQNAGVTVGIRPILDFSTGQGVVLTTSDTGQSISIQTALDSALTQTKASDQAGSALLCSSASNSTTAYTCALSPTLTAYTTGMVLRWRPDVTAPGAATLNVDSLGAIAVKMQDGATDPAAGDLVAGRMVQLWYDGTVFRILQRTFPSGTLGEAQPTCAAAVRGRFWYVAGATGVKDSLSLCAKNAMDVYAWVALY